MSQLLATRLTRFTGLAALAGASLGLATLPALAQASLLSPAPIASTPAPAPVGKPPAEAATPALTLPPVPAVPPAASTIPAAVPTIPAAAPAVVTPTEAAPAVAAPAPGSAAPAAGPVPTPVVAAKPKRRPAPPAPPRETALSTDPEPTLTPETFFATAKASERYLAIADAGGWPEIPGPVTPGSKGKIVSTLRLRLAIEGDLGGSDGTDPGAVPAAMGMFDSKWGPDLTAAVKKFQARHGLKETGIVAGATLKAMNVPARVRFTELASSAQRLAGRQFAFGDRYVVVNIPSAAVETVENGRVTRRFVAVVGDPDHASPEVDAKVVAVNLNPTWTVPMSIIKNEIIPKMQRDPGYLSRARIRILDGSGNSINAASVDWTSQRATNYILRQDSGSANSLGSIRINMPNKFSVYMHDTPSKRLFGGDYRFLSHGCVRVQGVYDLASWLLEGTGGAPDGSWDRAAIEAQIATGEHEDIKLAHAVPVAWVYLTGWTSAEGTVNFRDDVYGLDTVGSNAQAAADDPIAAAAKQ